jgi:hypothetical protein
MVADPAIEGVKTWSKPGPNHPITIASTETFLSLSKALASEHHFLRILSWHACAFRSIFGVTVAY